MKKILSFQCTCPLTLLLPLISPLASVRNLGVTFDPHLSFSNHISNFSRSCFMRIRDLRHIENCLHHCHLHRPFKTRLLQLHLFNLDSTQTLQFIQNSLTRAATRTPRHHHITPILKSLHWLKIPKWIHFKVLSLTYNSLQYSQPTSRTFCHPANPLDPIHKLDLAALFLEFPTFVFSTSVRDLGVILDQELSFFEHITALTRSCFCHLRQLRVVSRPLSAYSTATLVHTFIVNRLDHCSSLYCGLPQVRLQPLDGVLRAAARMIGGIPKFGHISEFMRDTIHWLPVRQRIHYRLSTIVSLFNILSTNRNSYNRCKII